MTWLRLLVVGASVGLALPASALGAGDRAAFELRMADLAKGLSRPNAIAFLVGLGDWYCQVKMQRGGGPLDIQEAAGEFHRQHPDSLRSADDVVAQDAALADAAELLCP